VSDRYDVVIVGGGAAGFTAGIYAARDRCRALLVERFSPGGQVLNCEHIENFPGFPDGVAGYTLGPLMQQQATAHGLELQMTEVHSFSLDGDDRVLETDSGTLRARCLIVASGSSITTLGIPGEAELAGKGVSHCASCDGAFFMTSVPAAGTPERWTS
jgi:thioredoxin reductase (NADPH)